MTGPVPRGGIAEDSLNPTRSGTGLWPFRVPEVSHGYFRVEALKEFARWGCFDRRAK